jgi:hypothetical protein
MRTENSIYKNPPERAIILGSTPRPFGPDYPTTPEGKKTMTVQPNCPRCGHEKFAIIEHVLYSFQNQKDKQNYYRIIELLCCDSCGAVICQYDKSIADEKVI